ncbi:MAG TPA: hypothetical protein VKR52_04575 [Terracidiphilus sp.]|nr:hypothetical protein [Terracidiphilus sp.]
MPTISKEKKQYLVARVRSVLAQDHQIGLDDLADRLDREYGIRIERHYLSGIVRKLYAERTRRADHQTLNYALAAFEDSMTQVVRVAWEIANDQFARKQDRVMALREIREAHSAVFEKLFDAGVFERKLGTLDATIRNTPLPPERKEAIRSVFENWGLLEAPKEDATGVNTKGSN